MLSTALVSLVPAAAALLAIKVLSSWRARLKTVQLRGPVASSWLFGVSKDVFQGDSGLLFENWAAQYGPAFHVPGPFGSRRTVLFDPKAIATFFQKETFTFRQSNFAKKAIANIVGKGLLYAEGESHRRQRRALTPAFSNAALRNVTPVFYESGYKVKSAWDALIGSSGNGEAIIDVQQWMNCVSLDSIGIAGFGHDFGALDGSKSDVKTIFDSFSSVPPRGMSLLIPLLAPILPLLQLLPTTRSRLIAKLNITMASISNVLLERSRKEKEAGDPGSNGTTGQTLIGALLNAENSDVSLSLSPEEVMAQMKVLILAGYETTSISLTWVLIELALHPEKQARLRKELSVFSARDPSYDQLLTSLPYLDGVMREVLRLHPPLGQLSRVASEDEVLPFNEEVTTSSGKLLNSLPIAKDTSVIIPIRAINRSEAVWGPDSKEFVPERWLEGDSGLPAKVKEFQGYHHLLTFVDGQRICLGRGFAVAEFKSVLSVLIRNFGFEMRDGPETKVDSVVSILQRPKVEGEQGYAMPLRVKQLE